MKETLREINALQEAGIIGQSAIGGAMGATFYLEPISTYDLDIFVLFESPSLILTLAPIYEFLQARGRCHHDLRMARPVPARRVRAPARGRRAGGDGGLRGSARASDDRRAPRRHRRADRAGKRFCAPPGLRGVRAAR